MKRARPALKKPEAQVVSDSKKPIDWVRLRNRISESVSARPRIDPFFVHPDLHPPKARPAGVSIAGMAQDSNTLLGSSTAWASAIIATSFAEGVQFLGYPYLAELAQRPEYRVISQTIAEEMTRKWLKFEVAGQDQKKRKLKREADEFKRRQQFDAGTEIPPEDVMREQEEAEEDAEKIQAEIEAEGKAERINQLEEMFKDLNVKECMKTIIEQDGFFGRSHLYLDTGDTDNREELRMSIGSGKDALSRLKVRPDKPIVRIRPVEAVWCYPMNYDSVDPLKPTWYKPETWFVMGKEVHVSRLPVFVGNEVPDLLKPAYSFGGLSMSQMAQPYVNNWLQTRQSVNDLIQSFVVWRLSTNLSESLSLQGDQLYARLELFNRLRNNRGIMVTDKDTEEFQNTTAPLSGLEQLQAQAQEHMAAVSRIPLVKLLGIQPSGLNASSEGEIRVFYDTIHGRQESFLTKQVTRLMHFCMLSLWGEVDNEITFSWNPLWALDEVQKADLQYKKAQTAQIWIDTGVIDKQEERRRVAEDPETSYPGLDPNVEIDLKEEEEQGLVPKGGGAGVKAVLGEEPGEEPQQQQPGPTDQDEELREAAE